jgi:hypothetical protein
MSDTPSSPNFHEPPQERSFPTTAVAIAAVAVVVLVVVLVMMGRRNGKATLDASYAPQLALSNISMSESDTMTGGKVTYLEGHIQNNGPATITAVTVKTMFPDDVQMPPQTETTPLRLIRIREPEIDTEPVSAAPIAPGKGADFQLIFENVNSNWNEQQPTINVVGVETK